MCVCCSMSIHYVSRCVSFTPEKSLRTRARARRGDGKPLTTLESLFRCAIEVQNGHGRAQRRRAARPPHRVPHRHSSGRRRRGERRRSHGRRRQYRRAARGHRRARRDLPLRGRLSPGQGPARSRGQRSRPDRTQEHRRAGAGLFASGRASRRSEAGDAGRAERGGKAGGAAFPRRTNRQSPFCHFRT